MMPLWRMKPIYCAVQIVGRALTRTLFGLHVEGAEHVPREGGMLLAVNHVSYADPAIASFGISRELHFMAKRELFRNPLFGGLIRSVNALPVDRGAVARSTLEELIRVLRNGGALLVFPEGTRSRDGAVRNAHPGFAMLACAASVPVVPAYIRGTHRMGRSFFRRGRMAVFFGEPIDPGAIRGESRKDRYRNLGEEAMRRIRELQAKNG